MSNPSYGNWLGILKWSLAQQDNTAPSDFRPMSEEVSIPFYPVIVYIF